MVPGGSKIHPKITPGGQILEHFYQKIQKIEKGGPRGANDGKKTQKLVVPTPFLTIWGVIWGAIWGQFRCKIVIKKLIF